MWLNKKMLVLVSVLAGALIVCGSSYFTKDIPGAIEKSFSEDSEGNIVSINAKTKNGLSVKIIVENSNVWENGEIDRKILPEYLYDTNFNDEFWKFTKRVVTTFRVTVDSKSVIIPTGERLGLFEINYVIFEPKEDEKFVIHLIGGDASTSYEIWLYFANVESEIRLIRSENGGGECCPKPYKITTYSICDGC